MNFLALFNIFYYGALLLVSVLLFSEFVSHVREVSFSRFCHIMLSTAAYVPLMTAGIVVYSKNDLIGKLIPPRKKSLIHGILLSISFIAVTLGIAAEFIAKEVDGRKHFPVAHGILGLISWLLTFTCLTISSIKPSRSTWRRVLHSVLGLAAFLTGIASLYQMRHRVTTSKPIYYILFWGIFYVVLWSNWQAALSLSKKLRILIWRCF